jgi:hypothetical protein
LAGRRKLMVKEKKNNRIIIILAVSLVVIFLLLVYILNLWIKLSIDREKSIKQVVPVESKIDKIRPRPVTKRDTIIQRDAARQESQSGLEKASDVKKGDILIN